MLDLPNRGCTRAGHRRTEQLLCIGAGRFPCSGVDVDWGWPRVSAERPTCRWRRARPTRCGLRSRSSPPSSRGGRRRTPSGSIPTSRTCAHEDEGRSDALGPQGRMGGGQVPGGRCRPDAGAGPGAASATRLGCAARTEHEAGSRRGSRTAPRKSGGSLRSQQRHGFSCRGLEDEPNAVDRRQARPLASQ